MIRWIIRLLVVAAGPAIGWFQIAHTPKGILVGVLCSLLIIAAEIVIERIPLDNLVAAVLGAILGTIAGKTLDYVTYLLVSAELYDKVHKYSLLINILMTYLGMVVAIHKKEEVELLDRNIFIPTKKKRG